MDLQNVLAAMVQEGVSAEDLHAFVVQYGIQDHPFMQDVLRELLIWESTQSPSSSLSWSEDQADDLLEMLKSPTTEVEACCDDMTECIPEPVPPADQFEPWSPGFASAALECQDHASASLACVLDGEFE